MRLFATTSRADTQTQAQTPGTTGWQLFGLVAAMHGLLLMTILFPQLAQINGFDEASYVYRGQQLAQGTLTNFARNPLVSMFYSLIYLGVQDTALWLIHCVTIGRILLFGLIWFSVYDLARQLHQLVRPALLILMVVVTPIIPALLLNPSDAFFAGLSTLAFSALLRYHATQRLSWLAGASAYLGLAALARNDGLTLLGVCLLLALLLPSPKARWRVALAMLPGPLLVASYLCVYGLTTGSWDLGLQQRSYVAFEQGQGVAYSDRYAQGNPYIDGQLEARRLYGTPEDNNYSVIRAIGRNPKAFMQRVGATAIGLLKQFPLAYGVLGSIVVLLALRGMIALIQTKHYAILFITLGWPLYLLTYFMTFFRAGYLLLPFGPVIVLAAYGAETMLRQRITRIEGVIWEVLACGLLIVSIKQDSPVVAIAALLLAGTIAIAMLVPARMPGLPWREAALAALVGIGILLAKDYPAPRFRSLGTPPDEQAALFLRANFAPNTVVGAYTPGNVWIANLQYAQLSINIRASSQEQFLAWLATTQVKAIYVDDRLRRYEPAIWSLIQQSDEALVEVFSQGPVQIFAVTQRP